jgi:4-oxalocrotonate tautomerase
MPVVTVEMWEGRTIDQKKQLVKDIAAAFVKIGVQEEHLQIILKDVPKHNWATGSKLASEN